MTLVRQPAPRPAVGGRRGDDAGQRAADLLPPPPPVAGGDLEVPADLLGGHRLGAARQLLPGGAASRRRAPRRARRSTSSLRRARRARTRPWLKAAFLLFLVGYGTKMGLAPHAHVAARRAQRGAVGGLGPALRRAAELRVPRHPARARRSAPRPGWRRSRAGCCASSACSRWRWRRLFIVAQTDYKRMLAYSSVEHMGILALGVGIGGWRVFGAMLHARQPLAHQGAALPRRRATSWPSTDARRAAEVRGRCARCRCPASLWLAGFLAITGSPPFGTFLSEFTILRGGPRRRRTWRGRRLSRTAGGRLRRHGAPCAAHGAGARRPAGDRAAREALLDGLARRLPLALRRRWCSASSLPAPLRELLARGRRALVGGAVMARASPPLATARPSPLGRSRRSRRRVPRTVISTASLAARGSRRSSASAAATSSPRCAPCSPTATTRLLRDARHAVGERLPALTPDCPAGALVRARDRRAVGRRARRAIPG